MGRGKIARWISSILATYVSTSPQLVRQFPENIPPELIVQQIYDFNLKSEFE